jgi:hypothetical protein
VTQVESGAAAEEEEEESSNPRVHPLHVKWAAEAAGVGAADAAEAPGAELRRLAALELQPAAEGGGEGGGVRSAATFTPLASPLAAAARPSRGEAKRGEGNEGRRPSKDRAQWFGRFRSGAP